MEPLKFEVAVNGNIQPGVAVKPVKHFRDVKLMAKHKSAITGEVTDLGVIATREVTDDFVEHLVDTLQSADSTFSDYKWQDSGTGTTAEDQTDSDLETPTGLARIEGTQEEGGASNIYQTVATITYDGAYSITEHGVFNLEASTGAILLDRSVFSAIVVGNNDEIEWTYRLTVNAGG